MFFSLGAGSGFVGTAGAWANGDLRTVSGAVSVVGTNGATFYITGVQLEAGSIATPFEHRPYGTELALCQRYYEEVWCQWATAWSASMNIFNSKFKVSKRSTPTCVSYADTTPLAKTGATGAVRNTTFGANITIGGVFGDSPQVDGFVIDYNPGSSSAMNMRATVTASAEL